MWNWVKSMRRLPALISPKVWPAPVVPVKVTIVPVEREQLFNCSHFVLWQISGQFLFTVGAVDEPRMLVCIEDSGGLEYESIRYAV